MNIKERMALARQMEDQIRMWLGSEGAEYLSEEQVSEYAPRVDFLVTEPVPFVIEVIVPSEWPRTRFHKAKRLLAQRIALAQRFGPYMPLIVVVPAQVEEVTAEQFPFVDDVFSVDELPPIRNLKTIVRLNPTVQEILHKGEPDVVEFADYDQVAALWSRSLTLEQIASVEDFPKNTVACRLHSAAIHFLQTQQEQRNKPDLSDAEKLNLLSRRFSRKFDHILQDEIVRQIGGKFVRVETPLVPGKKRPSRGALVWRTPHGRRAVIKSFRFHPDSSWYRHKTIELAADAWMLRALGSISTGGLVLLLGTKTAPEVKTIAGVRVRQPIDAHLVNSLQAAGWQVFPWDFAEPEPVFIEYLQWWSGGRYG